MAEALDHGKIISVYIKMRDKKEEIMKVAKAEAAAIETQMEKLELVLLGSLNSSGVDNMAIRGIGTVYKEEIVKPTCGDWPALYAWISENDAFHFLEKRVTKNAVVEYLKDHSELPPGINILREHTVRVRRA